MANAPSAANEAPGGTDAPSPAPQVPDTLRNGKRAVRDRCLAVLRTPIRLPRQVSLRAGAIVLTAASALFAVAGHHIRREVQERCTQEEPLRRAIGALSQVGEGKEQANGQRFNQISLALSQAEELARQRECTVTDVLRAVDVSPDEMRARASALAAEHWRAIQHDDACMFAARELHSLTETLRRAGLSPADIGMDMDAARAVLGRSLSRARAAMYDTNCPYPVGFLQAAVDENEAAIAKGTAFPPSRGDTPGWE